MSELSRTIHDNNDDVSWGGEILLGVMVLDFITVA